MPQTPNLSRFFDAGVEFVSLTRNQARERAADLVAQGQLAQNQVQGFVDDLMDESRRRTDVVVELVRHEIQRQVKVLGIATKEDLARLDAKLAKQAKSAARQSSKAERAKSDAKKAASKKKSDAKKKSEAKKSDAKKSGAKKSDAKKKSRVKTETAGTPSSVKDVGSPSAPAPAPPISEERAIRTSAAAPQSTTPSRVPPTPGGHSDADVTTSVS